MAIIVWTGKKATVKTSSGEFKYTLKKVKGIVSQTLYNAEGMAIKGGFQSLEDAKEWLEQYAKGMK